MTLWTLPLAFVSVKDSAFCFCSLQVTPLSWGEGRVSCLGRLCNPHFCFGLVAFIWASFTGWSLEGWIMAQFEYPEVSYYWHVASPMHKLISDLAVVNLTENMDLHRSVEGAGSQSCKAPISLLCAAFVGFISCSIYIVFFFLFSFPP